MTYLYIVLFFSFYLYSVKLSVYDDRGCKEE